MTDVLTLPAPPAAEAKPSGHPKRWLVLVIVLAAECMDLLDGMIVNVAAPAIGLSAVLGPVLGGALVDLDLFGAGWRTIFLINVPLGLAALAGAARVLPESRAERPTTLDLAGAALVSLGAGLLIYPLIQG